MSAVTDISDSDKKRPWLKTGRKSKYTPQIAASLCRYISLGYSLRKACSQDGMPAISQVFEWKQRYPEFQRQFEEATVERGLFFGDKIGDLAEQVLAGEVDPAAARVAMDGYKFTAARLASRTWGEKSQVTVEHSVSAQAAQVLQELAQRGKARQIEAQCIDVTPVADGHSLSQGVAEPAISTGCEDTARVPHAGSAVDEAGPRPPAPATTPAPGCSSSTLAPRKRLRK